MRITASFLFVVIIFLVLLGCDQLSEPYKTNTFYAYLVPPQNTSDSIQTSTVFHYAYVDTRISQAGKLLVFLGDTGSAPSSYTALNKVAGSLGYYVINLSYINTVDGNVCNGETDINCFSNFHEEMIFGGTQSDLVKINKYNSITNRILKLLQHLHKLNPANEWNQFYEGSELNYSKFILAGHGQGGNHAAYLAQKFDVNRVIMFSSPTDYSNASNQPAPWLQNEFTTSATKFYGLVHKKDETTNIARQYAIWKAMKMLEVTDTISAEGSEFNSNNALISHFTPDSIVMTTPYHTLTAQNYSLPLDEDRKHLKQVWMYLLGNSDR